MGHVVAVSSTAGVVEMASGRRLQVQWACPGYDAPQEGDQVVVVSNAAGSFVVGVLPTALRRPSLVETLLDSEPVASSKAGSVTAEDTTRVFDKHGALIFEYDPRSDRATLHVSKGDLQVAVPEGAFSVEARDGITMHSESNVQVSSARAVAVEAGRAQSSAARLEVQPGEVSMVGSVFTAAATRVEILAQKVGVRAHQFDTHVERLVQTAKVVETRAGRIVERAKDVYREVERLSQTRAGRLRMVAKKTAQLVGENTLLKARDRMKVKGERIHLA